MSSRRWQGGFTLIELIVVIVILGILAAVALPKFIDLGTDARTSVIKGAQGSLAAANSMIYARAAAAGLLTGTTATPVNVTVGGATVSTAYGYAATLSALLTVVDLNPSSDFDSATVTTELRHAKAPTPGSCKVAYTAATALTTPPAYTLTTTGC